MLDTGGSLDQLTTPELRNFDPVFPGENWFFYWKSSPSLWEEKLRQYPGMGPLLVPINWSLHSEYPNQYDFGAQKPETDLHKLSECALAAGKQIVFLLGLTPMPFVSNGGIPSYLVRDLSLDRNQMALVTVDSAGQLNRMYSFFDPHTFQAFRKFVRELGHYFTQKGISFPVCGLESLRFDGSELVSYFKDYSRTFENGFNRYVKQLQESEPEKIQTLIEQPSYEQTLKQEYEELVRSLYLEATKEFLSGHYSGSFQASFIGSASDDLFARSFQIWENENDYFLQLFHSVVGQAYPSSLLLNPHMKQHSFGKAIKDIVDLPLLRKQIDDEYYEDDSLLEFSPLCFFHLVDLAGDHYSYEKLMSDSGLEYFFNKKYPWSYRLDKDIDFSHEDENQNTVYFFWAQRLNKETLNKVLKLFMHGHHVFLDTTGISEEVKRKLEFFCAENNLNTQKINYVTSVQKISLGEGSLFTYEGEFLNEVSLNKRFDFWQTLIGYLNLKQLKIDAENGVCFFWKTRSSNSFELNYQEIRRVSLYNPTSYKKKVHLISTNNFAFIRSIDEVNTNLKSTPIGIDLVLLPGGSVTLDYGYYE